MTLEERNAFILENLRLVGWVSRMYANAVVELEDMEAIAALVLVRAADGYDPSKGAFSTYYHRAAWRKFNQCKVRRDDLSLDAHFGDSSSERSLYESINADEVPLGEDVLLWQDVKRIVSKLPDEHKESLSLYLLEGKSFAEIARMEGISRQGATQRMQNQLKKIRRALAGWEQSALY